MNISEMISRLEKIKEQQGDAELLICNQNGEVHYDFCIADWSEPDMGFKQLLIRGCVPNSEKTTDSA